MSKVGVLTTSVLFYSIPLLTIPFRSVSFRPIPFNSVLYYSIPFYSILLYSIVISFICNLSRSKDYFLYVNIGSTLRLMKLHLCHRESHLDGDLCLYSFR